MAKTTKGKKANGTSAPDPRWPGASMERLDGLKPYPNNARTHPEAQIDLLAGMMVRHGVDQPIVRADDPDDKMILKGHGRRLAGLKAGFTEFPVVARKGLPEAEKRAMRIEDNQVSLLAGWDRALLRPELIELKTMGYDMPLLGFDAATLSWMTTGDLVLDPAGEWGGMPAFSNPDATAFRSVIVHFKDQEAVDQFAKVTKQNIGEKTRFLWYPEIEIKPFLKVSAKGAKVKA